jgi:alkylation response protein AidB-like acyl-CoA dehydrogenase
VPRSHLDALAEAGLCGIFCPPAVPPAVGREIFEVLAGACGVTFFVWVQHHAPVHMLVESSNVALKERHLGELCSGRTLGGVAFAYLRRPGPPAVVARRVPGGYQVDGEAPWVTSWGLARLYSVAARIDDRVVFFLTGVESPRLQASAPLALAAMGASSTVRLTFDGLFVAEDDVMSVMPFDRWQAMDRVITAQPNPPSFGIAATCVRLLADHDADVAAALAAELEDCRRRSAALAGPGGRPIGEAGPGRPIGEAGPGRYDDAHLVAQVDARAESLALAVRAATALVTAVGGRAMASGHPAQRLLREAAFYTIQAQTPALRRATLARLTGR